MILDQKVEIKWKSANKNYYVDKGYFFTKMDDTFVVDINDLPPKSAIKIKCKCDFCGNECFIKYVHVKDKYHACKDCRYKKMRQTFTDHYPDKESRKEMRKRLEDTRERNTGFRSPFHDPKVREKSKQTLLDRTGYDNPWKDPSLRHDIQAKIAETFSKNQTFRASPHQRHLAELFHGELNKNLDVYLLDVVAGDIVIEYDGSGHDLGVGWKITQEDFMTKELQRESFIFDNGFNLIRIVSRNDYLLYDDEFLSLFKVCKEKFAKKDERKIVIDIDNFVMHGENFSMKISSNVYDIERKK